MSCLFISVGLHLALGIMDGPLEKPLDDQVENMASILIYMITGNVACNVGEQVQSQTTKQNRKGEWYQFLCIKLQIVDFAAIGMIGLSLALQLSKTEKEDKNETDISQIAPF